jgi:hypothetical protein
LTLFSLYYYCSYVIVIVVTEQEKSESTNESAAARKSHRRVQSEKYMRDESFALRLKQRILCGQTLTLDAAKIEGASMLRDSCKILQCILSTPLDCDDNEQHRDSDGDDGESMTSTRSTIKLKDTNKHDAAANAEMQGSFEGDAQVMRAFRAKLRHMESFCATTNTPSLLLELLNQILNSSKAALREVSFFLFVVYHFFFLIK